MNNGMEVVVDWRNLGHTAAQFDKLIKQHADPGSVTELDLSDNPHTDVPRRVVRFSGLRVLRLNDNCLTALPSQLSRLLSLAWLHVENNALDAIPVSFRSDTN